MPEMETQSLLTAYLNFAWVSPINLRGVDLLAQREIFLSSANWEFALLYGLSFLRFQQSLCALRILMTVLSLSPILRLRLKIRLIEWCVLHCERSRRGNRLPRHVVRVMAGQQRCWHVCSSRVGVALKNHFKRLHGAIATDILRRLNKPKPFTCLLIDWQRTKISAVR